MGLGRQSIRSARDGGAKAGAVREGELSVSFSLRRGGSLTLHPYTIVRPASFLSTSSCAGRRGQYLDDDDGQFDWVCHWYGRDEGHVEEYGRELGR